MDEDVKIKSKFMSVLAELIKNDYKVTDDTILEKLITHLSCSKTSAQVIDVPLCLSWVQQVFTCWHQGRTSVTLASFALRLMGIMVEDESNFTLMQTLEGAAVGWGSSGIDFMGQLQEMLQAISKSASNFSLKCALIQFLLSLSKHSSGCQWILSTGLWRSVCEISLNNSSIYVKREGRRFLSQFLNKMPREETEQAEAILEFILEPFVAVKSHEETPENTSQVTASLHLIFEIIDKAFLSCDPETNLFQSPVVYIISHPKFALNQKFLEALSTTKSEELEELLCKLVQAIYILDIVKDGCIPKDLKDNCLQILNVFSLLINKGSIENVLKLCAFCHNHWSYIDRLRPKNVDQGCDINQPVKRYQFEDQLLCLQLSPMFSCISPSPIENDKELYLCKLFHKICFESQRLMFSFRNMVLQRQQVMLSSAMSARSVMYLVKALTRILPLYVGLSLGPKFDGFDEITEAYLFKITSLLHTQVHRVGYAFRNAIIERGLNERVALLTISNILSLKHILSRERAVLVFQSFVYVLKHFVVCAESDTKQVGWGGEFRQPHHFTLLVAILDGLANLMCSHKITWRESVESLCLLTLAQELLDSPTFSSNVVLVVRALHLIRLCIENFLPPNLALLTNSLSGTSFDQLAPLIFKRLHDPNWEVRDSSLEVLLTLATISHTKYPLFQELILNNKLCELVVHLAINDAENYVCASATKCLTAMVRVDRLWNDELSDKDLVNKMISILSGESEGVLRREASLLICQIFKYRKVQPDVLQKICLTMANVVLSDLHWEVKVNALNFWELIIEHHMNDRGMIDGVFPQVTFSKEHRKIINLTPAAIHERLTKVLDELSQNGCLYVLLETLRKDEDLEVVKKASEIIKSLTKVLQRHGLLEIECPSVSNSVPTSALEVDLSPSEGFEAMQPDPLILFEGNESIQSEKPILDLDCHAIGVGVLSEVGTDVSHFKSEALRERVINSILDDRDINLLANVYLGTGVEAPGRQGPETKISKQLRPLVVLRSDEFICQVKTLKVDEIVKERSRWIEDTGSNLQTLLDDMLISRKTDCGDDNDECNTMDCY